MALPPASERGILHQPELLHAEAVSRSDIRRISQITEGMYHEPRNTFLVSEANPVTVTIPKHNTRIDFVMDFTKRPWIQSSDTLQASSALVGTGFNDVRIALEDAAILLGDERVVFVRPSTTVGTQDQTEQIVTTLTLSPTEVLFRRGDKIGLDPQIVEAIDYADSMFALKGSRALVRSQEDSAWRSSRG